jgi:hypothetical protein
MDEKQLTQTLSIGTTISPKHSVKASVCWRAVSAAALASR